jgi:hypothetical protein
LDQFLSGRQTTWEISSVGSSLMNKFVERDFPVDDGLRRALAPRVARLIDKAEEQLKAHPGVGELKSDRKWKELREWVKKLDPALAEPPAEGEASQPTPRPRRRSPRR